MPDHLGSDLDELLTERSQRPFLHWLGQCQTPQGIAQVVGQCEQLKTNLIVHEIMTWQPCPVQCILAFLNQLLGCASLVVEPHHVAGFPPKIRHNEADPWKQFDDEHRSGYWETSIRKNTVGSLSMLGLFDPQNENVFKRDSHHHVPKGQPSPMLYRWLVLRPSTLEREDTSEADDEDKA